MTVVKSAIVTSQKNAAGERTPRSAPMLMTTSAMSARVFIRSPTDSDSFQARPARRAASAVAPNCVAHDTAMTTRSAPQSRGSGPSHPRTARSTEQPPAEGVVEGRGGDRGEAHPRAREPRVHEDAAHDRDRRDRDGGGEVEPEGRQRGASRRERVEVAPHGEARREGDDDTGGGHGGGGLRRADEPVERELEANQEHEEDQPDLREGGEDRRRLPREERGDRPRIQVAEDGGAKDNPAQDLADHGRLSGEAEDPARDAGGGDDDREIRAEEEERLRNGERVGRGHRGPGQAPERLRTWPSSMRPSRDAVGRSPVRASGPRASASRLGLGRRSTSTGSSAEVIAVSSAGAGGARRTRRADSPSPW